jgi:tetratricopeptide (TPR) repeat protein
VNRLLGYLEEAIHQAKEAIEIQERLGDTIGQADCWIYLGVALFKDGQVDAAEDAAYRAINIVSESDQGQQSLVCESHQLLGWVYDRKRETEKAIYHYEKGLEIASAFNRQDFLFDIRFSLVLTLHNRGRLDEASAHIGQLKLDAGNNLLYLGGATLVQAEIWRGQRRLEDAKSEASRSLEIFESLGAAEAVEQSKELLWVIEGATESHSSHVHVQQ